MSALDYNDPDPRSAHNALGVALHPPSSASSSASSSPPTANLPHPPATVHRKYLCTTCDRTFTTSGHLSRHVRIHTGERNYKCPFPGCETRCSRQDNLQQHYRIHLSPGSRRTSRNAASKSRSSRPRQSPLSASPLSISPPPALVPARLPTPPLEPPPLAPAYVQHDDPPLTPPPLVHAHLPQGTATTQNQALHGTYRPDSRSSSSGSEWNSPETYQPQPLAGMSAAYVQDAAYRPHPHRTSTPYTADGATQWATYHQAEQVSYPESSPEPVVQQRTQQVYPISPPESLHEPRRATRAHDQTDASYFEQQYPPSHVDPQPQPAANTSTASRYRMARVASPSPLIPPRPRSPAPTYPASAPPYPASSSTYPGYSYVDVQDTAQVQPSGMTYAAYDVSGTYPAPRSAPVQRKQGFQFDYSSALPAPQSAEQGHEQLEQHQSQGQANVAYPSHSTRYESPRPVLPPIQVERALRGGAVGVRYATASSSGGGGAVYQAQAQNQTEAQPQSLSYATHHAPTTVPSQRSLAHALVHSEPPSGSQQQPQTYGSASAYSGYPAGYWATSDQAPRGAAAIAETYLPQEQPAQRRLPPAYAQYAPPTYTLSGWRGQRGGVVQ